MAVICKQCSKEYQEFTDMFIGDTFFGRMRNGACAIGTDDPFCSRDCAEIWLVGKNRAALYEVSDGR